MGPKWANALYHFHPYIEKNITEYWSGWRDQKEIGEALIKKLREVAL